MRATAWIAIGSVCGALGVALGAFGAHALEERLAAAGTLDSWHTAARSLLVHALILFGIWRERHPGRTFPGWGFLCGSLLFSGSIVLLALGVAKGVLGPLTPLGGALLIAAWLAWAWDALRSKP
jgi:uncharacterized membrane protein YgdD (TMEM256/DUF423 family)